jgi:hypothetical protein
MALFSQKTMQFVRAPDENVFIAPFNLIEVFLLILPFEWWMSTARYERLNNYVMGVIYSPLLLVTAWLETKDAYKVQGNRRLGESDEDEVQEWEGNGVGEMDFGADGWAEAVEGSRPNVETEAAVLEVRGLKVQVEELKRILEERGKGEGEVVNGGT